MPEKKVAVTIEKYLITKPDHIIAAGRYPSRSSAIEETAAERVTRMENTRLAAKCSKLDLVCEQSLAEEIFKEIYLIGRNTERKFTGPILFQHVVMSRPTSAGKNLICFNHSAQSIFRDAPERFAAGIPGAAWQ